MGTACHVEGKVIWFLCLIECSLQRLVVVRRHDELIALGQSGTAAERQENRRGNGAQSSGDSEMALSLSMR